MSLERNRALGRTLIFGLITVALYASLYFFHDEVLRLSKEGRWNFVIPLSIAFVFSIIHGNFTGYFWDLFGIKAKTTKK